ncbi:MAG: hypothetical protein RL236_1240 [Pseudomonadota bacterium]
MSNQENKDDGESSTNFKSLLVFIGCVALFVLVWVIIQSVIAVPMKMT